MPSRAQIKIEPKLLEAWLPRHITLSQRKALAGRVLFLECIDKYLFPIALSDPAAGNLQSLQRALDFLADPEREKASDSIPLDSFLKDLGGRLRYHAREALEGAEKEHFETLLSGFEDRVTHLSCSACTGGRKICDGGEDDHSIVANSGYCIEPLRQFFRAALEVATAYYRQFTLLFNNSVLPAVEFTTSYARREVPKTIPAVANLTAKTIHHPTLSATSEIQLIIAIQKFSREDYLSSFYILLHEALCHAFQGISPNRSIEPTARIDQEDGHDAFAEGWMDWVTIRILREIAEGRGPCGDLAQKIPYIHDHESRGEEIHRARIKPDLSRPAANFLPWGVRVANEVFAAMSGRIGTSLLGDPWAAFLRLSLELNLLSLSLVERSEFVAHLGHIFNEAQVPRPWHYEALRIVREYARNDSTLKDLIGQLKRLSST